MSSHVMRRLAALAVGLVLAQAAGAFPEPGKAAPALSPVVEAEEEVYRYEPANNGAGPMWCGGSTCLARVGGEVFASGLETLPGVAPPNNCRWTLYRRGPDGWKLQQADKVDRTREPCPLVTLGGRVFLSANPTLTPPGTEYGPARPEIFQFAAADPAAAPELLRPTWDGEPRFAEHTYRSFAADAANGEMILFQNVGYGHAEWAFRDGKGAWSARGRLAWPWGAEYDQPQPVRLCYATVALKGRAVYFCAVSDIVEPYKKWRDFKFKLTGQKWDYEFRRLFYTWCPDITEGKFRPWVEVATRDKTCGWITPCDLYAAPDGAAHLLWTERAIDERLRDTFFPDAKQSHDLYYAVVRDGKVVSRRALVHDGGDGERATAGRFQVTDDNRLFAVFHAHGRGAAGRVSENRVMEILPDGTNGPAARLPLKRPFTSYFTATVRAGSPPSKTLEMLGQRAGESRTISYARVRLVK